jgi:hypothetical protein
MLLPRAEIANIPGVNYQMPLQDPDAFPFRFHFLLERDLRLRRVEQLVVEVSSFDE